MKRKKIFISIMAFVVVLFGIYAVSHMQNANSGNIGNLKNEGSADNTQSVYPEKGEGYIMVKKLNSMESMIPLGVDSDIVPLNVKTVMDDFKLEEIDLIKTNSVIDPFEKEIQVNRINLDEVHEIKLRYGYFDEDEKYAQNYFFDFYCYDLNIRRDIRRYKEICDNLDQNRMFFTEADYQEFVDSSEEGDIKYLFFGDIGGVNGIAAVKEENERVYIMKVLYQNLSHEYVEKGQFFAPLGDVEDAGSFVKSPDIANLFSELINLKNGLSSIQEKSDDV